MPPAPLGNQSKISELRQLWGSGICTLTLEWALPKHLVIPAKPRESPGFACLVGWKFLHLSHLLESINGPFPSDALISLTSRGWVRS